MPNLFRTEPVLIIRLGEAVLALAVAFGLKLTTEQLAAIVGVIVVAGAWLTRSRVSPVKE